MNITRETRLHLLLSHGAFRDVLEGFDVPFERSWTLADACRVARADVDEVIVELELAESESDWDEEEEEEEWAFAG